MPDSNHLIRYDAFMLRALHDPELGYYARNIRHVGRRGDFTTAPTLSTAPARAIAQWIHTARRESGCHHVIEIGPGEGLLARQILDHLPWTTRLRLKLHLVERSHPLTTLQRQQLGRRASWHTDIQSALQACHGRALIYSNELIDAFPVRRFRTPAPGTWEELHLDTRSQPARETWLPCPHPPDSTLFSLPHPAGQHLEVHESCHQWLDSWLPHWTAGRMLTIDYGAPATTLLHRRPQGTLRAYWHHQTLTGPEVHARPGHQDITADVNSSDLEHWTTHSLRTRSLTPLGSFLQPHLLPNHPADQYLAQPHGPANAFFVLDQERIRIN